MSVRLRRSPPRIRNRSRPAPVLGLALLAVLAATIYVLHGRGQDEPRFRIERLPASAPPVAVASAPAQDLSLISLPPLAPPRPFLTDHRVVSFYGNPLTPILGVLGEQDAERTVARLRAQADAYVALSGDRRVVPAVHFIYAVAQHYAGEDGSFLLRMDDALVERYVRLTRDNGMLLFLDIQLGRSTVEKELPRIFRWLVNDHVHVALDPEFAWGDTLQPGEDIGHLDAVHVNQAQQLLQRFAMEHRLPTKILVVHQFLPGMVKNKPLIKGYDRVELVYDADGFGTRAVKLGSWDRVITDDNVQLAAIKLFYRHDIDLMSPADVLSLNPRPVIIIYQ
jgi:hypothetical protein